MPVKPPFFWAPHGLYARFSKWGLFQVLTLSVVLLHSLPLSGQSLPAPELLNWGPSTVVLGGTGAAASNNHDALLTNPANLIFLQGKRSLGGYWQWLPGDNSGWSVSVIDGASQLISGVQFTLSEFGPSKRLGITLGSSYKLRHFSVGVSTSSFRFSHLTEGNGWHFVNSAGILYPVASGIAVGFYAKNFADFEKSSQFPPSIHFGALFTQPERLQLSFQADRRYKQPQQDWNFSWGADILFYQFYALRGGVHWNNSTDFSYWSIGGAVLGPRAEISGYYMKPLEGKSAHGAGFDLTFKF